MAQRLANVSIDVNASINDLNFHAAHTQKAGEDIFRAKSVKLPERLQTFFQQEVSMLPKSVDEAACDGFCLCKGTLLIFRELCENACSD